MLLFMTAFAVWLGVQTHRAREQEKVVEAVQRLGGQVTYSDQILAGRSVWVGNSGGLLIVSSSIHKFPPPSPSWLQQLIGEHFFRRVGEIRLSGAEVTDALVPQIGALGSLRVLYLQDARVTDQGLAHLEGLASLEVVHLDRTQITDEGLRHLQGLENLEELSLNGTAVSDAGLKHLAGLTKLKVLFLGQRHPDGTVDGTKITDAGLDHVKGLTSLEFVSVAGTRVTSSGEEQLRSVLPNVMIGH